MKKEIYSFVLFFLKIVIFYFHYYVKVIYGCRGPKR